MQPHPLEWLNVSDETLEPAREFVAPEVALGEAEKAEKEVQPEVHPHPKPRMQA